MLLRSSSLLTWQNYYVLTFADRAGAEDPNNPLYIGLTIAISILGVIVAIVMIIVAIIYCFKTKTRAPTNLSHNIVI